MKRLTTEIPKGNYEWLHNMTVIKDKEVYLRDYNSNGDLNIMDYCKDECKEICGVEYETNVEEFGENMDCDCPVSIIYHMAVGHAELREYLKKYEDTGLSPDEIKKLKEENKELWEISEEFRDISKQELDKNEKLSARNRELAESLEFALNTGKYQFDDDYMHRQRKAKEVLEKYKGVE